MSRNTSKKISIVILGGGGAGAALAYRLATSPQLPSSRYDLTLVNDRPFQQHLLAGPRASVTDEGNLEDWGLIPYDTIFGAGKTGSFKQGTAENVDLDNRIIKLVGGEQLRYDYLVLATGSKWEGPLDLPIGTKNEAIGFIKEWRRKVSSASQVCVVGGGAVGIEMAAEIKFYYPSIDVTIVHADPQLINSTYPDKFRKALAERLKATGVKLILGDYVELPDALDGYQTIKTKNGREVSADLWIPARGPKPNTDYLPSSVLTEQRRVRVLPTLQVQGYPNVFAAGDIIEWPEQKQIAKTGTQADIIQPNLLNVLTGGHQKMKLYKGGFEGIFVTIGKTGGRGYIPMLWGIVAGDWMVASMKSKSLFLPLARKNIGAPPAPN